jgi:hypothetical protein
MDPAQLIAMEASSRKRHRGAFTQEKVLTAYEELLLRFAPVGAVASERVRASESVA